MKKGLAFGSIAILTIGSYFYAKFQNEEQMSGIDSYIEKYYIHENGTISTYETKRSTGDENDILSESIGLYMEYLLAIEDKKRFKEQVNILERYFIQENGFIYWIYNEDGSITATGNAFVDDIRIIETLKAAAIRWNEPSYQNIAKKIEQFITTYQINNDIFVDYTDANGQYPSPTITLSYIKPKAMTGLSSNTTNKTIQILKDAPSNPFYPIHFNVNEQKYEMQDEVNMIDQALIAQNLLHANSNIDSFIQFIYEEWDEKEKIYGRYNSKTMSPTVAYESPSTYAILLQIFVEINDKPMADALYDRLVTLQNELSGYSFEESAHFFDTIYPLLAITEYKNTYKKS